MASPWQVPSQDPSAGPWQVPSQDLGGLWLRRSVEVRRIPRAAVRRVVFSGRDRAAAGQDRLEAQALA